MKTALCNKYTKWYYNICHNAKARAGTRKDAKNIMSYVEGHHITPRCMGGTSADIVYVDSREHVILHWLLTKMFPEHTTQFNKALSMLGAFARVTKTQLHRKTAYVYKTTKIQECIAAANSIPRGRGKIKWTKESKLNQSIKRKHDISTGKVPKPTPPSQTGKIYINNGVSELRVSASELNYYIETGYSEGRLELKCPICGKYANKTNLGKYHKHL